jgi:hypothetical protein
VTAHENDLEVRWLVHTPVGPLVVKVGTRNGRYVATLVGPPDSLRDCGHAEGSTAYEAVSGLVERVSGTAVIPLPPRDRRRHQ